MKKCEPLDPERFYEDNPGAQMWMNDRYTVIARIMVEVSGAVLGDWRGPVHLSIRRNDRKAAHDWRDFQRIKNDICGEEREGVELYPAESRLIDTSNQYHLWVWPRGSKLPIGWDAGRVVMTDAEAKEALKERNMEPIGEQRDLA